MGRAAWRKDTPEVLFYTPVLDALMNGFWGLQGSYRAYSAASRTPDDAMNHIYAILHWLLISQCSLLTAVAVW